MNTRFSSIESINDYFEINAESVDELKAILRKMQTALHPDKTGGAFENDSEKERYHKLSEAISFVEKDIRNTDLVTISAVTDLTKAVTAMVSAQANSSSKNSELTEEINRSISGYKSKLKLPRIALTAITVAISAIWFFPSTVEEHPVLSKFIDFSSTEANFVWFYSIITMAALWFLTWRKEEITKERQESLKTESVQNRIFTDFIESSDRQGFVLEDLVDYIMYRNLRRHSSIMDTFGGSAKIDSPLAHATAEVIIERAIKRNAIISTDSGSISTIYQVTAANKQSQSDA